MHLAASTVAGGAEFEYIKERSAGDILPRELLSDQAYQIADPVELKVFTHIYRVSTESGEATIVGDLTLRRYLKEIKAIKKLQDKRSTSAFTEAAGETLKDPLKTVVGIVDHPVETTLGIPRGIYRLLESGVKGMARDRSEYEDNDFEALVAVSSYKRDFAAELGVDVYSSNQPLQKELERLAWASVPGYASVSLVLSPLTSPVVQAYKVMGVVEFLNDVIQEKAPADLYVYNEEKLKSMKIGDDLVKKFLNHPLYSPRHQTVLTHSLAEINITKGRDVFLATALNALSEEEAFFYQQIAEIFREYHGAGEILREITRFRKIPVGMTTGGGVFFAVPLDYLTWNGRSADFLDEFISFSRKEGAEVKIDFWTTGTLSAKAKKEFSKRGVTVSEDIEKKIPLMD